MAKKTKTIRLNHTQKLLQIMISGSVVTHEEIDSKIGDQIQMYKISTYIWAIKTKMGGIVKVVKSGRKVTGYQLMNVADLKIYMKRVGILDISSVPVINLFFLSLLSTPPFISKSEKPHNSPVRYFEYL